MSRRLSQKLVIAAAVWLVVVLGVVSSHAHASALPDEPCSICATGGDSGPVSGVGGHLVPPSRAAGATTPYVATPGLVAPAAYSARAPPTS